MTGDDGDWVRERAELLVQLAAESARAAELVRQLGDRADRRPVPREASARLLAREAERHRAEVALLREAERVAVARTEVLARQLRDLRAELHAVQAEHATERMQAELELARARAEAAGLQAAARRRAELLRPTPDELQARRARHEADAALLSGGAAGPLPLGARTGAGEADGDPGLPPDQAGVPVVGPGPTPAEAPVLVVDPGPAPDPAPVPVADPGRAGVPVVDPGRAAEEEQAAAGGVADAEPVGSAEPSALDQAPTAEHGDPVIVPPEWAEPPPARPRRPAFWRR